MPPCRHASLLTRARPPSLSPRSRLAQGRVSAGSALEHEYLRALHNVNDEPAAEQFDFAFEDTGTTESDLKRLIWAQLLKFHHEAGAFPG